jgi:formylglycine-generating enzyme required for sulfatase activity
MATGLKKSWGNAGWVGIALAFLAFLAIYFISVNRSPALALLGSPELCAKYSGLPSQWGSNSRAGMVHLNGGEFTLGTILGYEEERQEVKTQVKGFWLDQTEVTVAQFGAFVKATGYVTEAEREGGGVVFRKPSAEEMNQRAYAWWGYLKGADWRHPKGKDSSSIDNQPVTLVTLADALAYAKWLGRDLPTEAEWEYAAKAGQQGANLEKEPRDSTGKPTANFWQGVFPTTNTREDGHEGLAPVGCYVANEFKIYDLLGNVWEQTKDIYTESHELPLKQVAAANGAKPDQPMVVKGGSHLCGRDFCVRYRPSAREAHEANLPVSHIGFRTVLRDNESKSLAAFNPW